MQSIDIPQTASELISLAFTNGKYHRTQLMAKWQKIDGKLICQWISVDCD